MIVRVKQKGVLNRTVVVESDSHFDKLYGSHRWSQIDLYHVS